MLPAAIAFGVFAWWSVIGLPLVYASRFSRSSVRNLLLAPVAGACLTVLPIFWLSRLGFPVKATAWPTTILEFFLSCFLYWRYRPKFAFKSYIPFASVFVFAFLLTGRPMFAYGFDWISYANDDMANYTLAAERLFNYAYGYTPDLQTYLTSRDPSLHLWFIHVYMGARTGAELLLAWLMGITGKHPLPIFMPLIVSLHLALISSCAALMYRTASQRLSALLTALLLACSALVSLGTLYQLLGQVWGLTLLVASMTVLMRPVLRASRKRLLRMSGLSGLILSGLIISYPEVLAFLMLAISAFSVYLILRSRAWKPLLLFYAATGAYIIVFVNTYLPQAALFFTSQFFQGVSRSRQDAYLFPYYLLPSGLANLWGFAPINMLPPDPWLSVAIALGGVFLVLGALAATWQATAGHPAAMMASVMLLLAVQLFRSHSDFGLFKLAMFIQPFLIGSLVSAWLRLANPSR